MSPAWNLEGMLRSPRRRVLPLTALVLLVSWLATEQLSGILGSRWLEVPWWRIFAHQLLLWTLWALVSFPIVGLAGWMRRKWQGWTRFVLAQLPLSLLVAGSLALAYEKSFEIVVVQLDGGVRPATTPRAGMRPRQRLTRGILPRQGVQRAQRPPLRELRWREYFVVYWLVLGLGAGMNSFLNAREREREAAAFRLRSAQLETEVARAQLDQLRDQLRPHFLFNVLHTVGALFQQGEGERAMRVLAGLGDLLRTSLEGEGKSEVSLREELKLLECYLDIERERLGDRLAVEIAVEAEVLDALVPFLLLQPLVENAVRHGIAPRPEGGSVRLRARRVDDSLELEVIDDGPGFPPAVLERGGAAPEDPEQTGGVGLRNGRERLRLLYGDKQSFVLDNDPQGGARVRIRLPFEIDVPGTAEVGSDD